MDIFDELIALLELLQNDSYGEWVIDKEHKGTADDPIPLSYLNYTEVVHKLIRAVYNFSENNPDYNLTQYRKVLEDRGLKWNHVSLESVDVFNMDAQGIMALLMSIVRSERFCDGAILAALKKGIIQKCLFRLKQISGQN